MRGVPGCVIVHLVLLQERVRHRVTVMAAFEGIAHVASVEVDVTGVQDMDDMRDADGNWPDDAS